MEVTLKRLDGQTAMEQMKRIPKPSQLDDWNFYEKIEAEEVKNIEGDAAFVEWIRKKEAQKTERENWRSAKSFPSKLGPFPDTPPTARRRRRSSVMLELPGQEGSRVDPKEDPNPKKGGEGKDNELKESGL